MLLTENDWIQIYIATGALWEHDGNPNRPHPILRSGLHSGHFFNNDYIMQTPKHVDVAADELVEKLEKVGLDLNTVDRVVGPAMGAITLACSGAWHISAKTGRECLCSYGEKLGEGANMKMVFNRIGVEPGERVLLVEDVVTTSNSVKLVARAVTEAGGILLPFIGILVNRSDLTEVDEKKIVAILDLHDRIRQWNPDNCKLCKDGSQAIMNAKSKENWARLIADYPKCEDVTTTPTPAE